MALQDGFSPSFWQKQRLVIDANSLVDTALIPINSFHSARYHFSIFNDAESKSKSLDLILNREGLNLKEIITNKIGNSLNISIASQLSSGKMSLEIENKENFSITIELFYLLLGRT